MTFCHLTDILHKAFFGFLGRLGQYFIAEFADVETEKIETVTDIGYHRLFLLIRSDLFQT